MAFEKGQRFQLKRPFWGHPPGTKGRITAAHPPTPVNQYTGKLKLRGSPLASVADKDADDLLEPVSEAAQRVVDSLLDERYMDDPDQDRAGSPKDMWRQGGFKPFSPAEHDFTGKRPGEAEKPAEETEDDEDEAAEKQKKKPALKHRFNWRPTSESRAKRVIEDHVPGGRAPDSHRWPNLDPEQLATGTQVEMEHTTDPAVAEEIAADHLTEDPEYYQKLQKAGLADELNGPSAKASFWPTM